MDAIDVKLLELLQHNAEMTIQQLSAEVHLSTTPCWKRIKQLKNLGFKFIKKKFQEDIYFNGIDRDFRETDEALRIRDEDGNFFVTYKGPKIDKISKTREEIEVRIEDKEKMRQIFKRLGFKEVKPIKKIREICEYTKN